MKFIDIPNLPQNDVNTIIAGKGAESYSEVLSENGVSILYSQEIASVSNSTASHADLAVNYLGKGCFLLEKAQISLYNQLKMLNADCRFIKADIKNNYPNDCALNFIKTDRFIIGNKDAVCHEAVENIPFVNVKQGYTKCSVLPVFNNAFITDDESVFNALDANECDVLLVKKGSVTLSGYNYGFIGGCGGKIRKHTLAFCGNIKRHINYNEIKSFCDNYKVEIISLSDGELTDVGSLIPITEKE